MTISRSTGQSHHGECHALFIAFRPTPSRETLSYVASDRSALTPTNGLQSQCFHVFPSYRTSTSLNSVSVSVITLTSRSVISLTSVGQWVTQEPLSPQSPPTAMVCLVQFSCHRRFSQHRMRACCYQWSFRLQSSLLWNLRWWRKSPTAAVAKYASWSTWIPPRSIGELWNSMGH